MEIFYAQDQKTFAEAIKVIRAGDCVRIDSISAGYSMTVSRSGASELTPVWRIGTDTGVLLIDAESGKVIK